MPLSRPPDRTSWHEAGHAVVAHIAGGRVREVTLEHDDDSLEGQVAVEWSGLDARAAAEGSARTALGGPLAELAFLDEGEPCTLEQLTAWAADWEEVERCARALVAEPGREDLVLRWLEETRELLADPEIRERVARVADALDAHETLDEVLFADAIA